MIVSILKSDGFVSIDGVFTVIDLTSLPINFRTLQWDGGAGVVEWTDGPNTNVDALTTYQTYVDAAVAAIAAAADPYYGMSNEEIVAAVTPLINAEHDSRMFGGISYGGNWFPSDIESRSIYNSLAIPGGVHPEYYKTTLDSASVLLTLEVSIAVVQAWVALLALIDINTAAHIAGVSASSDPGNYDYSTGWPTRYTA